MMVTSRHVTSRVKEATAPATATASAVAYGIMAPHSYHPTAMPTKAPVPASPTKCSDPMLEANKLAVTAPNGIDRSAKK